MKNQLLFTLVLFFVAGATTGRCDDPAQKAAKLDVQVRVQMDYLIYLPKDYEKQDSWPLLVYFHGSGEVGNDVEQVKKHGPPKLIAAGKEFPFIVVSPQCGKDKFWEAFELAPLLNEIESKYKVDRDRIYMTGNSMGGYATWMMAARMPDRLAAIAPICGGGEPFMAKRVAHIPTWIFHGAKDRPDSVERSYKMLEALKKEGADPKFTMYPDLGHDCWTTTYENPELYEWLLAQKRTEKKK